jgi:hypothetical protein
MVSRSGKADHSVARLLGPVKDRQNRQNQPCDMLSNAPSAYGDQVAQENRLFDARATTIRGGKSQDQIQAASLG